MSAAAKRRPKHIRESLGDRIFMVIVYIILTFCLVVVLYPLIYVVSASFSSSAAIRSGEVWLYPVDITLQGYEAVFSNHQIMTGFLNSFIYTFAGTAVNLVMTMLCAYPLSR